MTEIKNVQCIPWRKMVTFRGKGEGLERNIKGLKHGVTSMGLIPRTPRTPEHHQEQAPKAWSQKYPQNHWV